MFINALTTRLLIIIIGCSICVSKIFVEAQELPKNSKTKSFDLDCLAAHNKYRRLHNAPELTISKKITQFAQKRADHIAKSDGAEFKHPPNLPYGENLAWHSWSTTSCDELVKMWYDEVSMYNFKNGDFDHSTGHFTQLVWKETHEVGCARAISKGPRGGITLVCNYDPPGNYLGEFKQNVQPKGKYPIQTTKKPLKPISLTSKPNITSSSTIKPIYSTSLKPTSTPRAISASTLSTVTASTVTTTIAANSTTAYKNDVRKKKKKKKSNKNKNKNKKTTTTKKPQSAA